MEYSELILVRRSVRKYQEGTHISDAAIKEIIQAAQLAPSWKNSQTGRYYIVKSPEALEDIRTSCLPEFNQNSSKNAPVLVVTAFEKGISGFNPDGTPTNELGDEWGSYDLGLQNAYMLLKARELGIDSLIMGIRDADKLREKLSVPASQEIVAVIALGYSAADPVFRKRKEISEICKEF